MEATETTVRVTKTLGRWNIASDAQGWRMHLLTPFGSIVEFFEDEPEFDDTVRDALAVIEARVKSWLYKSGRADSLIAIAKIKANLIECELLYAKAKLARLHKQEADLRLEIARATRLVADLQEALHMEPEQ